LRAKGEAVSELVGSARVMRGRALGASLDGFEAVDMCGTGGDGKGTFNVSTTASFVVAGAGVPVAKHGNRAASSRCGSADLLEALGAAIDLPPDLAARCVRETGIGFFFAPTCHPAMRFVAPVRQELGIRTLFNLLGPLLNPACVRRQLVGVFDEDLVRPIARVMIGLGATAGAVVHGGGGFDEATSVARNRIALVRDGVALEFPADPGELGMAPAPPDSLRGGTAAENARITLRILRGEDGPRRDTVLLNAALALLVGDGAGTLKDGLEKAAESVDSGRAMRILEDFLLYSRALSGGGS
jgi:anthranilate phosphoribosyltransferase